jgi:SAM-dependent methyltransferase
MIAAVREYWNRRPCNIRHSPVDIDESPGLYSRQVSGRKYHVEPHISAFADFPRWDSCSVLELGCGIGTDTLSFAAHGASVVAVDISEKSLEIARRRAQAMGQYNNIVFLQSNIEKLLPIHKLWPGRVFDLVYSFGVLHHTPHPAQALDWIKGCMHDESLLKIMLYHRYTPKVLSALRHWRPGMSIDDAVARMSEAQRGCPITYTYTKDSAADLLQDFEILDMHVDHIFPYRVQDYINYRYVFQWYWRILPPKFFHWLERHLGWHLLITARLK